MISLDHVTLLYGTVIGVNDFHFDIPRGAYALVGPNGAGKSTLIGLLTGAMRPTLGRVTVFGEDPFHSSQVMHRVGLCPASDPLVAGASGRQWIELQLALSGWRKQAARERTVEVLEAVGMLSAMDRPISTYSLGMRQRCKLAQAIAHEPELLILDEPFNGLDPVGRHDMGIFLKNWATAGKSLLLASHVLHEVERITSSFLLIYGGRLLASGTANELRRLLAGLPQEMTIRSSTLEMLAERLSRLPALRSFTRVGADSIRVSVDRPLELFESMARWVKNDGVNIDQVSGEEGEISALFHLLISRHRGESLLSGHAS